jgi:hypothetical protein
LRLGNDSFVLNLRFHHKPLPISHHSQECRKGAADARSPPQKWPYYHNPNLHLVSRIDAFVVDASSLLESPDLAFTVWAALTLAGAADHNTTAPSDAASTPPPPYMRRSWPRFFSLLHPSILGAVLARVAAACGAAAACISFLATRRGRQLAGAGALWPIRDTLRDLMVHRQPSARRVLRETFLAVGSCAADVQS